MAVQVMESDNSERIPKKLKRKSTFKWLLSNDFVMKLNLHQNQEEYTVDPECRQRLLEGMPINRFCQFGIFNWNYND